MPEILTSVSYSSVLKLAILCLTFLAAVNMICASVRAIAATRMQLKLQLEALKKSGPIQPNKPWPRD